MLLACNTHNIHVIRITYMVHAKIILVTGTNYNCSNLYMYTSDLALLGFREIIIFKFVTNQIFRARVSDKNMRSLMKISP